MTEEKMSLIFLCQTLIYPELVSESLKEPTDSSLIENTYSV